MASLLVPPVWWLSGKHRHRTLENLRAQGLDEHTAIRRGKLSYRSNLIVLFESLGVDRMIGPHSKFEVEERISPEAQRILDQLRCGEIDCALGLSGHIGSWEYFGALVAARIRPVSMMVSARVAKNPILVEYMFGLRERLGMTLVAKDAFLRRLLRGVQNKERRLYTLLCDQHYKGGDKVPFLGRPACTVPVPARLMVRYRIPALIGSCIRLSPGRYRLEIDALPAEPYRHLLPAEAQRRISAAINAYLGAAVESAPEQWTWGHRRWRKCCADGLDSEPSEQPPGAEVTAC
jgi:lauroyl/myristoyl acyltransferase